GVGASARLPLARGGRRTGSPPSGHGARAGLPPGPGGGGPSGGPWSGGSGGRRGPSVARTCRAGSGGGGKRPGGGGGAVACWRGSGGGVQVGRAPRPVGGPASALGAVAGATTVVSDWSTDATSDGAGAVDGCAGARPTGPRAPDDSMAAVSDRVCTGSTGSTCASMPTPAGFAGPGCNDAARTVVGSVWAGSVLAPLAARC